MVGHGWHRQWQSEIRKHRNPWKLYLASSKFHKVLWKRLSSPKSLSWCLLIFSECNAWRFVISKAWCRCSSVSNVIKGNHSLTLFSSLSFCHAFLFEKTYWARSEKSQLDSNTDGPRYGKEEHLWLKVMERCRWLWEGKYIVGHVLSGKLAWRLMSVESQPVTIDHSKGMLFVRCLEVRSWLKPAFSERQGATAQIARIFPRLWGYGNSMCRIDS